MRRTWVYALLIALLMTMASADIASAKKSRSRRVASTSHAKRETRGKRGVRAAVSRRDRRGRDVYATRGRRGRRLARSRRYASRREPEVAATSGVSRPMPGIPSERVTEIQNALIKANFLEGPASGQYDDATIGAMKQFQAANGMSQTGLPSAPLLKRLGVPKRSNDGYAVPVNSVSQTDKKRTQE